MNILITGGNDGGLDDQTWIWNNSSGSWTQVSSPSAPSARENMSMNIINDDYVMLFGGNDGTRQNDTRLFDISARNWTEIFPTTSPGARFSHFEANYLTRDLLMFEGTDGSNLGDTWIFSLLQDPQILDFELTKVISNTARFRARINDGNDEANYYIQYGTSSGKYDFRTEEETIDNCTVF